MLEYTGFSFQVQQFDKFFIEHQEQLKADALRMNSRDYEDMVMDSYIKIRNRIQLSGFTITKYSTLNKSLYSFFWRSLYNSNKTKKRLDKRKDQMLDASDDVVEYLMDEVLQEQEHDKQAYYDRLDVMVRYLFKFVQIRYSDKHNFLFKSYYLNPDTRSYDKLTASTGYKRKYIVDVIQTIKQDIRTNFIDFINEEFKKKNRNK